jgi:hypothetical protein
MQVMLPEMTAMCSLLRAGHRHSHSILPTAAGLLFVPSPLHNGLFCSVGDRIEH